MGLLYMKTVLNTSISSSVMSAIIDNEQQRSLVTQEDIHKEIRLQNKQYGSETTLGTSEFDKEESIHEERKFKCEECGNQYNRKDNLTRHLKSAHIRSKLECDQCGKLFSSKDTLATHQKSAHEGIRSMSAM